MKNRLFALIVLIIAIFHTGYAQIMDPVKWSFSSTKSDNNVYELLLTATIDEGWHMYSQHLPNDDGPIATSFTFEESSAYKLVGKTTEPKAITEYDPNFDMDLNYFEGKVTFRQKVQLKAEGLVEVKGALEFMVCDASKCLPPEWIEYSFKVGESDKEETADGATGEEQTTEETETVGNADVFSGGGFDNNGANGIQKPIKWTCDITSLGEQEYSLSINAEIEGIWHVYSQKLASVDGPVATSFLFNESTNYERIGEVEEAGNLIDKYDSIFEMELRYFEHQAVFTQKVKLSGESATISGELEFMACNNKMCLAPESVPFEFVIGKETKCTVGKEDVASTVSGSRFGEPLQSCGGEDEEESEKGLLAILFLGILGGFIALLTPCVFPMIPLTVSFFTKKGGSRRKGILDASLYGFSIVLIYFLLSVPFLIWNIPPDILNEFSTNVWVNVIFFVVFIVFAISFFGYFEIRLPSKWGNQADTASNVGGFVGIFFMALTLALVSFSCTGPILGTLLVGSLTSAGGSVSLVVGMTGFGLALALPFALFAAFPQWLNSLPQSGGWLNSIKVVLGFLEVGLALKFLSNADLVSHWGLLKREVFIGLWILTGTGLTLYFFGKIKFPHDSPIKKLSIGRIGLGLASLAFVAYLIPGMWGSNLKLLSGFPPPMFYSLLEKDAHCPHNLPCFHDYEEGLLQAQRTNKPIIIDFTGWACVNCRKMEENVWVEEEVYNRLQNEFVLISLYVDDKEELPEEEQIVSAFTGKKIKTIGNKWSDFQATNFNANTQPFYVLISPDEKLLVKPVGYTPDVDEYIAYLDCGIDAFKAK